MPPLVPSACCQRSVLHDQKAELLLLGPLSVGEGLKAFKLHIAIALFLFAADVDPVDAFFFQALRKVISVERVPSCHLFGIHRIGGPPQKITSCGTPVPRRMPTAGGIISGFQFEQAVFSVLRHILVRNFMKIVKRKSQVFIIDVKHNFPLQTPICQTTLSLYSPGPSVPYISARSLRRSPWRCRARSLRTRISPGSRPLRDPASVPSPGCRH